VRFVYLVDGKNRTAPEALGGWELVMNAMYFRRHYQHDCLAEMDERGLQMTDEQLVIAGLACPWPRNAS
jgi:hypothetical protein